MTTITYTDPWLNGHPREFVSGTKVIYFVQVEPDGPIKIGTSTFAKLRTRLTDLQVGCPWPLVLRRVIRGDRSDERRLHNHFARYRMSGEWFVAAAEVAEASNGQMGDAGLIDCAVIANDATHRRGYEEGFADGVQSVVDDVKRAVDQYSTEGTAGLAADRALETASIGLMLKGEI